MARDESSSVEERTKGLFLVACCVLFQKVIPVQGQTLPTFDVCPSLDVPEDTAIGEKLFSIKARVNEGSFPANNLTFNLEGTTAELVNLTQAVFLNDPADTWQWSSDVILRAPLDRDFEPFRRPLSFGATDTNDKKAILICDMKILDVNDNAPSFQGLPYNIEVDELTDVGTVLRAGISATDPDLILGGQVTLHAQFSDPSVEQTFNTTTTVQGSGYVMDIILAQPLDYETRTFYTFSIMAVDGEGLNTTAEVRVTVTDAQDTPPVFLLDTYRAAIREHQPVGTPVITVSAVDGDRDPPNGILYSIVQGRTDYFSIDNSTGSITSSAELDRDNVTMVDTEGVFELTVRATETDDVHPQRGETTAEVEVVVVVEDINDHPPAFARVSPYTGFVREDAPLGSLIYFDGDGYIFVSDADQGRNSHFNLSVERDGVPWPVLQATPSEVFLEALVLLRVMERDAFKEFAGTHISLQLVAREVSTVEGLSSTAEIVITVQRLPQPTTLPPPTLEEKITAPDIVVFIIGFLVIFNVVATACIIWFVRRSRREETPPRQGLDRRGSKYYVNGMEKESRRSSEFQNGSAVSLRSESVLVEVDGKDRCDVVPLGAGAATALGDATSDPSSSSASSTRGQARAGNGGDDVVGDEGQSTDRKVLLSSEVAPAKSSLASLNSSADSLDGSRGMSSASSRITSAAKDNMPNFSKAKRNVSSPKNPAFSFSVPNLSSASNVPALQVASTTSKASGTALTSTTPSASAESMTLEPVTRFSAKGAVSTTTVAAVAVGQPASAPATVSSRSGRNGTTQVASTAGENGSMAEILY